MVDMYAAIEIPRALRDIRLDLIKLNQNLPANNSDNMAETSSEVLEAKYFTEARYYPNYATATGHSEFLKQRTPSDTLFVWFYLKSSSTTTWEFVDVECNLFFVD
ncbi:uncharacterized protein DFL_008141 [Arthrobotrys flagrans]|uniref:Uncharacterized protein n=1 Tax=Arthrobotrys flagrans TaxID=97331 RepID=A0A436ZMZ7_ARTFL|nr:hypothetical protein DFL_008141 [Arthrobotrys flagrans]